MTYHNMNAKLVFVLVIACAHLIVSSPLGKGKFHKFNPIHKIGELLRPTDTKKPGYSHELIPLSDYPVWRVHHYKGIQLKPVEELPVPSAYPAPSTEFVPQLAPEQVYGAPESGQSLAILDGGLAMLTGIRDAFGTIGSTITALPNRFLSTIGLGDDTTAYSVPSSFPGLPNFQDLIQLPASVFEKLPKLPSLPLTVPLIKGKHKIPAVYIVVNKPEEQQKPVATYAPPTEQTPVTYKAPKPVATYEAPQLPSTYDAPLNTYEAPRPVVTYEAPVNTYEAPSSVYEPPRPSYGPPQPAYSVPTNTYEVPRPVQTYEAPKPTYGVPQAPVSYEAPSNTYEVPSTTYEAPKPSSYGAPQAPVFYEVPSTTYEAPKPSYGAPQTPVTYEVPSTTYEAPKPSYVAPAQAPVSYEVPSTTYEAPKPSYVAPQAPVSYEVPSTTYEAPKPSYVAPQAPVSYEVPSNTYEAPKPAYEVPRPVYEAPKAVYTASQTPIIYEVPKVQTAYEVPKDIVSIYAAPKPVQSTYEQPPFELPTSYENPRPVYGAPPQTYDVPVGLAPPSKSYINDSVDNHNSIHEISVKIQRADSRSDEGFKPAVMPSPRSQTTEASPVTTSTVQTSTSSWSTTTEKQ